MKIPNDVENWCSEMAYEAKAVANYFLDFGSSSALNPMKIQKLVYFAHGWHLAIHSGEPLIDEAVQAWTYGPVIPSLYHEFKKYGSGPITSPALSMELSGTMLRFVKPSVGDEQTMDLLGNVWEVYGDMSAVQLSNLTHEPGSPWHQVYSKSPHKKGLVIPDALIGQEFLPGPQAAFRVMI